MNLNTICYMHIIFCMIRWYDTMTSLIPSACMHFSSRRPPKHKYPDVCLMPVLQVNEKLVRRTVDLILDMGLDKLGYEYIIIDGEFSKTLLQIPFTSQRTSDIPTHSFI